MIIRTSLLLLLEHDVEVQVLPVQSGGRKTEEGGGGGGGGGGEEEEPPKKKAKVMLLQVKKKGEPEGNRLKCIPLLPSPFPVSNALGSSLFNALGSSLPTCPMP